MLPTLESVSPILGGQTSGILLTLESVYPNFRGSNLRNEGVKGFRNEGVKGARNIQLQDGFIRILKTNLEEEILFYLTNKGININDQDKYGNTILFTKCQELAQNYKGLNWNRNNPNKNINEHIAWFEKRILKTKKEILLLYEKWGADPLIENNQRQNCFATSKKLKDKEAIEMEKFLTLLLLPRNLSPDSHKEY